MLKTMIVLSRMIFTPSLVTKLSFSQTPLERDIFMDGPAPIQLWSNEPNYSTENLWHLEI